MQEWKLSVAECPALATQLTAYENIQFVRPRDDDAVAEHPILYEFHESVAGSDSEAVEYVESRAFPKWAVATRKAIEACIAATAAVGAVTLFAFSLWLSLYPLCLAVYSKSAPTPNTPEKIASCSSRKRVVEIAPRGES